MKIEFENEQEKECLKHILLDWFSHNGDSDVLGCEPACRNPKSLSCKACIEDVLHYQLNKNELRFYTFGGEDWIQKYNVEKYISYISEN